MERFFSDNLPVHRTVEGKAYEAYFNQVKKFAGQYEQSKGKPLTGKALRDPAFQELMVEMGELNGDILAMKDVTGGPAAVHQDTAKV